MIHSLIKLSTWSLFVNFIHSNRNGTKSRLISSKSNSFYHYFIFSNSCYQNLFVQVLLKTLFAYSTWIWRELHLLLSTYDGSFLFLLPMVVIPSSLSTKICSLIGMLSLIFQRRTHTKGKMLVVQCSLLRFLRDVSYYFKIRFKF